jgi:branched-chain amino acid transport system permease protein
MSRQVTLTLSRHDVIAGGALAVIVAGLAAAPGFADDYVLSVLLNLLSYIALATAWAFFSGPTRYISLAASAFFGTGAYAVAVLGESHGYAVALAAAVAVSALLALLVGLATLRLRGMYFVIFTFGLAELVRELVTWMEFNVAGAMGRYVFLDITTSDIYYQVLVLALLAVVLWWLRDRSRFGYALSVIGSDETVARQIGINVTAIKLAAFVASAVIMALVGAALAPRWSYIDPSIAFNPSISFLTVIMALLGGMRRFWGPALGVVPLTLLSDYLSATVPDYFSIALGACFLVIVFFIPNGLAGLVETRWAAFRRGRGAGGKPAVAIRGAT